MPQNPPPGRPRVTPYLFYEDAGAALDWLSRAFGFQERVRMPGDDGSVMHGEMAVADGRIMLGRPGGDYVGPGREGRVHQLQYVYVDDVDAHHRRATEAGATVVRGPEDQFYGDRTYTAADLAGHQWTFAQHVRDVTPEEMRPPG
jgi:PhnB protein